MQESSGEKQQIVDRIKQSANILVTVSSNPSVDALSAALSLALMLNKMDKHATAVFSGVVPPAINFLQPAKTFERNVDSLRDFIIALDKEKADRLRYKVEDDVVKVFITPYRTTITQKDLQFSQGDFNVDLIVALGVEKRDDLDKAITAHGRILHDATVVTVNAANQQSDLGSIDWHDATASSLCEMLVNLSEGLQPGILDQQISTAMLTGIVAATDRFSNGHTTPEVMNLAAKLMAAGANQQLIANNLQTMMSTPIRAAQKTGTKIDRGQTKPQPAPEQRRSDGEMVIRHEEGRPQPVTSPEPAPAKQQVPAAKEQLKVSPMDELDLPMAPPSNNLAELKQAIEEDTSKQPPRQKKNGNGGQRKGAPKPSQSKPEGYVTDRPSWMGRELEPPTMGGTLNATAEQALEDSQRAEQDTRNRTMLSHDESSDTAVSHAPQPLEPTIEQLESQTDLQSKEDNVGPQQQAEKPQVAEPTSSTPIAEQPPALDDARKAVDEALQSLPPEPEQPTLPQPAGPVAPALPAQPTEPQLPSSQPLPLQQNEPAASELPPLSPASTPVPAQPVTPQAAQPVPQPELPPLPPLPPLPGFENAQMSQAMPPQQIAQLPPLPAVPAPSSDQNQPGQSPQPPVQQPPADPSQYRIPGQ